MVRYWICTISPLNKSLCTYHIIFWKLTWNSFLCGVEAFANHPYSTVIIGLADPRRELSPLTTQFSGGDLGQRVYSMLTVHDTEGG